jgi:hypothetical protein
MAHTICNEPPVPAAGVGRLGFVLHAAANFRGRSSSGLENLVHGAPALAPLLFPSLVLLAVLGLWVLAEHLPADGQALRQPARPEVCP